MEDSPRPQPALARQVLPKPLLGCIEHIFGQQIQGTSLVGGTALAGYYAGHRRSDDIDLFCGSEIDFRAAVLAARSLEKIGVSFSRESHSAQYFHGNCLFRKYSFTIDVVLDENLFKIGKFEVLAGNVTIPSLDTLLRMKIATLVSRASEKDLFDMEWLFGKFPHLEPGAWISLAQTIDRGVNGENLLASIAGTTLRKEACDFSLDSKVLPETVFEGLLVFQKKLVREISFYLKKLPTPPFGRLVKKIK